MLKTNSKIIGKCFSAVWIISTTIFFVEGASVQIGSKQQTSTKNPLVPFTDFKAEAEVYSESHKILRLKITWNPKMTNDSTFEVVVQPIHGGECHDEWCNLHGQITENATLFVPSQPKSDGYYTNTCEILPGCNYTITVESAKFKSKLIYTVPDRVGNVYSCQHVPDLPSFSANVKVVSQSMIISWKINEILHVRSDIRVYIVASISKKNDVYKDLEFFNHTLDGTKQQQSGEFKWAIPSKGVDYLARISIIDSNDCQSKDSPYTQSIYGVTEIDPEPENKHSVHVIWLIIGMSASVITLIALLIYCNVVKQTNAVNLRYVFCCRRSRRPAPRPPDIKNPVYDGLVSFCSVNSVLDQIPHSSLQLLKEIGRGAFGRVYLARAENICGIPGIQHVAVKQLKKRPTPEEKEEFICEIQTMKRVSRHPNIVTLLGCCTQKEPLQMVMEYVGCGDLLKYLREVRAKHEHRFGGNRNIYPCQMFNNGITKMTDEPHQPLLSSALGKYLDLVHSSTASTSDSSYVTETEGINLRPSVTETMYTTLSQNRDQTSSTSSSLEYVLDHKELHNFATQIAKGMKHLHENRVTHRDLAARNILIDENKTLKISDFGLSRSGIYVNRKNKKVPLRWLSIEAMRDNIYSTKSDVWAFGIVLWEIGTLVHSDVIKIQEDLYQVSNQTECSTLLFNILNQIDKSGYPYPTVNNNELLPLLAAGYRLEKPENCSNYLYELMLHCWTDKPDDRPAFSEILFKLEPSVHQKIYVDFSELSSDYVFLPTVEQMRNNNLNKNLN